MIRHDGTKAEGIGRMEEQAKSKSKGRQGKAGKADLEYLFDVPVYR